MLFQHSVTLPSNIISATLSWSGRIYNYGDSFDENRLFMVTIGRDLFGELVFFIPPGAELIQPGPNPRSVDVTAIAQSLEGGDVGIFFVVGALDDDEGLLSVSVDDISLNIETAIPVTIDIKPGSEPNCFNNDGHGVIPVAILGSAEFDVTTIDAGSVMLEGLAVKAVGKSNKLHTMKM